MMYQYKSIEHSSTRITNSLISSYDGLFWSKSPNRPPLLSKSESVLAFDLANFSQEIFQTKLDFEMSWLCLKHFFSVTNLDVLPYVLTGRYRPVSQKWQSFSATFRVSFAWPKMKIRLYNDVFQGTEKIPIWVGLAPNFFFCYASLFSVCPKFTWSKWNCSPPDSMCPCFIAAFRRGRPDIF